METKRVSRRCDFLSSGPARDAVRDWALKEAVTLGFDMAGVVTRAQSVHMSSYRRWIGAGLHGHMAYLARPDAVRRRGDLSQTLPGFRSAVIVAHSYADKDPAGAPNRSGAAVIARYARGKDYHRVMIKRLEELGRRLEKAVTRPVNWRTYADTGPLLEREMAQRAGLGWFGRNTMLIHPRRGSYFFLGALLTDLPLSASAPFENDHCGSCRRCLDACPTGALLDRDETGAPVMDARRCISYLTIELKGAIPRSLRPAIGNRVFGCDICQEACPWNEKFSTPASEPAYAPRHGLERVTLAEMARRLLSLSGKGFQREFGSSPLARAGRNAMLRNVCVALGNWGSQAAVPALVSALSDRSPLVRAHAAWALGRIGSSDAREALANRMKVEENAEVLEELRIACPKSETHALDCEAMG